MEIKSLHIENARDMEYYICRVYEQKKVVPVNEYHSDLESVLP